MADAIPIEKVHVTKTPGVCGGKPCIAGTRIRVQDIYVLHELQRLTPDEIVDQFDHLTLADIYAALAYFGDHRLEVFAEMAEADRVISGFRKTHASKLAEKLEPHKKAYVVDAVRR